MTKKIPMRRCVGCGASKSKKELIRVIRTPEGAIRLDTSGRANGRGAYICNNPDCLRKAQKRRSLNRSLGCEIPGEIYEELVEQMEEHRQDFADT